jgi:hypothetical protein
MLASRACTHSSKGRKVVTLHLGILMVRTRQWWDQFLRRGCHQQPEQVSTLLCQARQDVLHIFTDDTEVQVVSSTRNNTIHAED